MFTICQKKRMFYKLNYDTANMKHDLRCTFRASQVYVHMSIEHSVQSVHSFFFSTRSTFTHWFATFWLITVVATRNATREPFKYYLIWSFSMQEFLTNSYYACVRSYTIWYWLHGIRCQLCSLFNIQAK